MTAIFSNYINNFMVVFMDDFSIFGYLFDVCHANLFTVLKRCEEANLILNWERVTSWFKKGPCWIKKCLERELRLITPMLIRFQICVCLLLWSKLDFSFVMLVSVRDLLRMLVKWLAYLLISSLKCSLCDWRVLSESFWKALIYIDFNPYCVATWLFSSIWDCV